LDGGELIFGEWVKSGITFRLDLHELVLAMQVHQITMNQLFHFLPKEEPVTDINFILLELYFIIDFLNIHARAVSTYLIVVLRTMSMDLFWFQRRLLRQLLELRLHYRRINRLYNIIRELRQQVSVALILWLLLLSNENRLPIVNERVLLHQNLWINHFLFLDIVRDRNVHRNFQGIRIDIR